MSEAVSALPGQETFLHTMELAGLGVLILDRNLAIDWISEGAKRMFGLNLQPETVHRSWLDLIAIDRQSVWSPELEASFLADGALKTEGYCDGPHGERISIEVVMSAFAGTSRRLVLVRDITERQRRETELREEKRNSDQLNKALEREIQTANDLLVSAERASIAKSVFLTSMSHEFRTPLNGVLGYAQILARDTTLNEKHRKAASTIESCGRHLLSLLEDVLDLSKIEAGKLRLNPNPFELGELLDDVIALFHEKARTKGIELSLTVEPGLCTQRCYQGDAKLIRQVLLNLVGNAVKFTESGSIRVNVSPVQLTEHSHTVRFSVVDTGPGISEEAQHFVFDEFYQTEAFSGHRGGTGLGLAICKRVVSMMQGKIGLISELGHGSEFWFEIPIELSEKTGACKRQLNTGAKVLCRAQHPVLLSTLNPNTDQGVISTVFEELGFHCISSDGVGLVNCAGQLAGSDYLVIATDPLSFEESGIWEALFPEQVMPSVAVLWLIIHSGKTEIDELYAALPQHHGKIVVDVPLNLEVVFSNLLHQHPEQWRLDQQETEQTENLEDAPTALGRQVPDAATLDAILREAQIGDMRAALNHLKEWEKMLGQPTVFGSEATRFIENFQTDQLCQYLESMASQG